MQEYLDRYITYLTAERGASPHTIANYRREIAELAEFARAQGVTAWEQVTPALLRQWLAALHKKGLAKASIARRLSEVRAFYAYLHSQKLVETNPAKAVAAPRLAAAPAAAAIPKRRVKALLGRARSHHAARPARSGHA